MTNLLILILIANSMVIQNGPFHSPDADHGAETPPAGLKGGHELGDDSRWQETVSSAGLKGGRESAGDPWEEAALWYRNQLRQHEVVGGALLLLREGKVTAEGYFGYADLETGRAVDRRTIFHWASLTKTVTAVAVMQLRDKGMLDLDDPLTRYLPEIRQIHNPYGSMDEITIRMALNHSTGLRNPTWPWGGNEPWHPFEPMHWEQLVAMFPYTEILFPPGSRHSYSNPAIIFLGRIIEQLSGDSWEVYVDKNILKPLGMHHSYFNHTPVHLRPYRTNSYILSAGNGDGERDSSDQPGERDSSIQPGEQDPVQGSDRTRPVARGFDFHTGITTSNGGLNASIEDMVRYLQFLLGRLETPHPVLERSSLEELWVEHLPIADEDGIRSSAALSFFLEEFDGIRVIGHTGNQWSNFSYFYIHPESGTAILGVTNTDGKYDMHRFRHEVSRKLMRKLFPR